MTTYDDEITVKVFAPPEEKIGRRIIKKFPTSAVINFVALLSLFAVIIFCQHIGQKRIFFAAGQMEPATALPLEKETEVIQAVPATETSPLTEAAEEIKPAPAAAQISEQEQIRVRDIAEISLPAEDAPPKQKRAYTPRPKTAPLIAENEIPVDELDNETARQQYLASNRVVIKGPVVAKTRPEFQATSSMPKDEFIPFEKK